MKKEASREAQPCRRHDSGHVLRLMRWYNRTRRGALQETQAAAGCGQWRKGSAER
ncbi:MAG: hypothetical protein AAGA91_05570 [Pseudomonadota bacterium]